MRDKESTENKDHFNPEALLSSKWFDELEKVQEDLTSSVEKWNKEQHDSESRKEITKLFLKAYFALIAGSFMFSGAYNFIAAEINTGLLKRAKWLGVSIDLIPYLDVSNTVSIITTTLSSGVGFVIGYYFKNKGE